VCADVSGKMPDTAGETPALPGKKVVAAFTGNSLDWRYTTLLVTSVCEDVGTFRSENQAIRNLPTGRNLW
jgi:hypothetical protein